MLYISQDIAHNLYHAGKAGDGRLNKDIISDEIAKLIVTAPHSVKSAILDAKISIGVNPSSKEIARILNANLSKNIVLRKNITSLLLNFNKVPKEMNFEGYMPKPNGKKVNENAIKADQYVYDQMYFAFNADDDGDFESNEKNLINKVETHQSNFDVINGKEKSRYKKTIIFTALIAIGLTVGGYFLTRYLIKKHKEKKYGEGGEVESSNEPNGSVDELGIPVGQSSPIQQNVGQQNIPFGGQIVQSPNGDIYDKSYLPK